MLLRDILIIVILLLILVVIKIINSKFIENFTNNETIGKETQNNANVLNQSSTSNSDTINTLKLEASDPIPLLESQNNLDESTQFISENEVLQKRNDEIDNLFNESHGQYIKHKNKKCDYLDINPPIPCEDINPKSNTITNCQINCAQNCLLDDNCISFEYDKNTKSCRLSSSCYDGNINTNYFKDVYFKRGAIVPALAQFNKRPNKRCNNNTKIQQNGSFNNQTLSECAQKCLDTDNCISFEFKENDGINSNVCNLTHDCHRFNYTNDNNSDVFMKNNVIVNERIQKNQLSCPSDNKRKIPFRKRIRFYAWGHMREDKRKWTHEFPSDSNEYVRYVGKHHNDDYDSIKLPPKTELILWKDSNYRHDLTSLRNNSYKEKNIGELNDFKIKRNRASSRQIKNL